MSPKMFSEQELTAWRLLPQQLPDLEELSGFEPNGIMPASASQTQPGGPHAAQGPGQEFMQIPSGSLSGTASPWRSLCYASALPFEPPFAWAAIVKMERSAAVALLLLSQLATQRRDY